MIPNDTTVKTCSREKKININLNYNHTKSTLLNFEMYQKLEDFARNSAKYYA